MSTPSRWLPTLLVVLSCGAALADDKIVVLKNGRRIQGELVEESDARLVVKTSGGTLTLDRSGVLRVEEIPPDLKPKPSTPAPSSPSPAAEAAGASRPSQQRSEQGTPVKGSETGGSLAVPVYTGAPAAVVSDCVKCLAEIVAAKDYQRPGLLREAIKRFEPGAFVTILAMPSSLKDSEEKRGIRDLAREVVHDAGAKARAPLTQAAVATRFMSSDVVGLLEEVFDSSVEDAIAGALGSFEPSGQRLAAELLGRRGTRRSAPALCALTLNVSDEVDQLLPKAVGQALAAIAGRDDQPWQVIRPLAQKVMTADKLNLPEGFALDGFLVALAAVPAEGLSALKRIAADLEHERRWTKADDPRSSRLNYQLASTYRALASTGDEDGLAAVEAAITDTSDPTQRTVWMKCLASATRSGENGKFIRWLIAWWDKHSEDAEAVAEVLGTTTGKSFGPALGSWREYADTLR